MGDKYSDPPDYHQWCGHVVTRTSVMSEGSKLTVMEMNGSEMEKGYY